MRMVTDGHPGLDHGLRGFELRPVRGHRHRHSGEDHPRLLRGGSGGPRVLQWYGHRRRLDERRQLHLHGGPDLIHGLHRGHVPDGMDGGIRPPRPAPGALSQEVREVR